MGVFDRIKRIFKKKDQIEEPIETKSPSEPKEKIGEMKEFTPREFLPEPAPPQPVQRGFEGDLRTKLDLISTQIESLRTQNQMIIERLKNLERMIAESRGIKYY